MRKIILRRLHGYLEYGCKFAPRAAARGLFAKVRRRRGDEFVYVCCADISVIARLADTIAGSIQFTPLIGRVQLSGDCAFEA
jgi:hypothetical protein